MSDASVRKGSFLQFAIIFALVYMLTQSGMRWLMPEKFADESAVSKDIVLSAE
ncbi:hypothetical protein FJZ28_00785, partial [Candidatus Peregrinibacteria bacterium]|nr:hypothetical protein [Candidatus Peregrinibacteria bacterium]